MEQEHNRYNTPQIILRDEKHFGLDKVEGKNVSFIELTKEGAHFKRTENKIELPAAQLYKEIADKQTKVVMPSRNFLKEREFSQNFQPPQMIEKESKAYGLDKSVKDKISYVELEKDGDKLKRTDRRLEYEAAQMVSELKEGKLKVLMTSVEKVKENQQNQFAEKFNAPEIIAKNQTLYLFDKREGKDLKYFQLEKEGDQLKRTDQQISMTTSELVREMKEGGVKVIKPSKAFVQQKEQQQQVASAQEDEKKKQAQEVKPIHIQPLTAREKKEVKEAFQENKLESDKHAKHFFQKFEKQLNAIPDNALGQKLSNHDKLKMLVGDLNDQKATSFKIEKDKSVSYQKGEEKGILTNQNTQFSAEQTARRSKEKTQDKVMPI